MGRGGMGRTITISQHSREGGPEHIHRGDEMRDLRRESALSIDDEVYEAFCKSTDDVNPDESNKSNHL
jgi:hypothetical protein